ncbi:MAG: phage terminase large subunit, partial [Anaerovoracaceae bacterium]
TTDILYGGSKGSGKSYLGCSLIFGDALTYPNTFYFIARKNLNDLRKYTIPSIHEVFQHWNLTSKYYSYNGQDNYFELYNKSRVYLLDAKYMPSDPDYYRFGSMQMTRGWIEEAGEFSLDAKNNLQASIGRWNNELYKLAPKLLQTCNPSKNYLYSEYYKKHKEGKLENYKKFIQALPTDNKCLSEAYLLNLERSLTTNQKERLLFGNWEYDDDPNALIDYDAICDLFTNEYVQAVGPDRISADLAMKGRDRFIAGGWKGLVVKVEKDMPYSPADVIERELKELILRRKVSHSRVVADSDGLGAYLESYIRGIVEFHNGGSAFDKKTYTNLKAECAYKLAEVVNNRQMRVICTKEQEEKIKEELGVLKAVDIDNDTSKKNIISKDLMKQLLGRSPDYLDMLIMGMYHLVAPKPRVSKGIKKMIYK